jgi:hypothetical protein
MKAILDRLVGIGRVTYAYFDRRSSEDAIAQDGKIKTKV